MALRTSSLLLSESFGCVVVTRDPLAPVTSRLAASWSQHRSSSAKRNGYRRRPIGRRLASNRERRMTSTLARGAAFLMRVLRARGRGRYWNIETSQLIAEESGRYGSFMNVRPRLGQGLFSLAVREAYRGACAVTHEHSGPVLEAAHILPYG